MFLGGDPESESVVNKLRQRQNVNHFLHEREAKMTVLQQREASLPACNNVIITTEKEEDLHTLLCYVNDYWLSDSCHSRVGHA